MIITCLMIRFAAMNLVNRRIVSCSFASQLFKGSIPNRNKSSNVKPNQFFITTPIFYVNDSPHIGHLYSAAIADATLRYQKLLNQATRSIFSTGTDEHGLKIQQAAVKKKISPNVLCDAMSEQFSNVFNSFDIDYSHFIRTSDVNHISAVQKFYQRLCDAGHIYKSDYSGWYCVSDESFLTDNQITEKKLSSGELIKVSSESGNPVEWSSESNYKFKLTSFQDDLLYWLKNEDRIKPHRFQKELESSIKEGLIDLSISRPIERVSWGVPVPGDASQSIYVWVDALVNYLTAAGYPDTKMWPPNLQVIGKDILKFHGIYWPALLIASGLEPPKKLLVHSHWTVDGVKMSKSIGNVVCPFAARDTMTEEGVRYYLLRQGTPHSDSSWRHAESIVLLNAELADTLGNLVLRCSGKNLNPSQIFPPLQPEFLDKSEMGLELSKKICSMPDIIRKSFDEYNYYEGIQDIMSVIRFANTFVQEEKPWEHKGDPDHIGSIIHLALSAAHSAAIMLQPIVPSYASKLLDIMGIDPSHRQWDDTRNFPSVSHCPSSLGPKIIPFTKIITKSKVS